MMHFAALENMVFADIVKMSWDEIRDNDDLDAEAPMSLENFHSLINQVKGMGIDEALIDYLTKAIYLLPNVIIKEVEIDSNGGCDFSELWHGTSHFLFDASRMKWFRVLWYVPIPDDDDDSFYNFEE